MGFRQEHGLRRRHIVEQSRYEAEWVDGERWLLMLKLKTKSKFIFRQDQDKLFKSVLDTHLKNQTSPQ